MVKQNANNGNGRSKKKNGARVVRRRVTQPLNAPRKAQGLMRMTPNTRPLVETKNNLRGSDFVTRITVKPSSAISTAADRIIATFPVTPSGYIGTRITGLANFWERYKLRSFNARYVPAVPMTIACQFVLYIDTDPNDDPTIITDDDALVRQAVAQTGAQQWNFNCAKNIPLARRSDDQLYYTGIDKQNQRFNRQGTAYLIQVTDPLNFNGEPITTEIDAGTIFIDWDVEFQIPQIEPTIVTQQLGASAWVTESFETSSPANGAGSGGSFTVNTPCLLYRSYEMAWSGQTEADGIETVFKYAPKGDLSGGGLPTLSTPPTEERNFATVPPAPDATVISTANRPTVTGEAGWTVCDQEPILLVPGSYPISFSTTGATDVTYQEAVARYVFIGLPGLVVDFIAP
jgi:hypothetical protein